jgi:hypothetical protein
VKDSCHAMMSLSLACGSPEQYSIMHGLQV